MTQHLDFLTIYGDDSFPPLVIFGNDLKCCITHFTILLFVGNVMSEIHN